MVQGLIRKEDLKKLIAAVSKNGAFFGPVMAGENVSLSKVEPDGALTLEYSNIKLPPKRLFSPQSEVIGVIFGVRPCDALSLVRLDKVFLEGEFVDPYYRRRRDNAIIISLACSCPLDTCFCTSVGGSPAGTEGADVLACDLGEALLFESVTAKGEAFMKVHSGLLGKATKAHAKARDAQASDAEKMVSRVNVSGIAEKLQGSFESPVWEEIARRCLGCGICTYLCPTCHCFGLYDEQAGLKGRRIRTQDSCMFPSFTLEASGHNSRTSNRERMRQRVMHKFCFTVENFGDLFCVGCGRCITNCPVNMDVRETVAEVSK